MSTLYINTLTCTKVTNSEELNLVKRMEATKNFR